MRNDPSSVLAKSEESSSWKTKVSTADRDLVESRMDDFIKMRLSKMTEKEQLLAQSMIANGRLRKKGDESMHDRDKDLFKISRKEDDYFQKMTDHEQMRLYTTLHDQNTRLRDHIKELKKEFLALLQKIEGKEKLDMKELEGENKLLREELQTLTFQNDKVISRLKKGANTRMGIPAKQKKLLKAYGTNAAATSQPTVQYTDKKALQAKIDELMASYKAVEAKVKECHQLMHKAGIRNESAAVAISPPTADLGRDRSPQELRLMITQMESRLEALSGERDLLLLKTRTLEEAIKGKHQQLQQAIDDNIGREQRYIAIRSRDPIELQNEIRQIKAREIELTNRIHSLQALPMYKNDHGTKAITQLQAAKLEEVDLQGQLASTEQMNARKQDTIVKLKLAIDGLQIDKQNLRKEVSRAKAMNEAMIQRQQYQMYNAPLPKFDAGNSNLMDDSPKMDDEYNDRLIRTLGLIRWKGEEPAWHKLQFLEKARRIDPNDQTGLREEYARLIFSKKELTERLDRVQGMLKITTDDEKKKEDEHLLIKKKKENELMRLEEARKEMEETLDRVGMNTGKVFIGKNQRTGEDVYYNDGVSVFSMDKSDLFHVNYEENLLDLYLSNLEIDPHFINPALEAVQVVGVNPATLVTVLGVNFYNHPTATSQKCFGIKADIKFQATFAFKCDGFFIEYSKKHSIDVEIFYTNEHGLQTRFATAQIELQKLLEANQKDKREDYIGVVNSYSRVITLGGQPIGILNYRLKTRLPIYHDLLTYNQMHSAQPDIAKAAYDLKYLGTERRLNIKVCNGYGFSPYAKTFVSYKFMSGEDTTTRSIEGSNPHFDHSKQFTLIYTHGLRDYFRNDRIEFNVFDDNVPFNARSPDYEVGKLADVIGSGASYLLPLTYDKPIVEKVYLKDVTGKVRGSLFVKMYWDGLEFQDRDLNEFNRAWEDGINKKVIAEMRAKQLTMRGLFNIGDQDHSPGLSKDEFRNVIVNVLGVHLTPQEFKEYWFRVHRGSKNDEVTFQHLLTYYGHLLDAQLLGKSSMGQDVAGLNKIFKTGDERLDGSPEDFYLAQILQKFSDEIARVKKEKHYTDMQIFKMYDTDKDSRISLMEFKDISTLALKLSTPLSDLDRIFMWVDKDKTGKIDLVELFKILKFNLDDYLKERQASDKSLADHPDNWSNDRVILSFIQALEAYMKKNELTVYQVYAQMDKKPDSSISRAELEKFIKVKIIPDISARHIRIILTEIDKSGDDKISVKELAKFLERSEVYKMINNKKDVEDLKSLRVLQVIHQYLIDHDKKPIDLIYDMDSDKSGSIDQFELADYVLKLNKDLTTADISQFLLVVDRDGSKNLSVKEIEDTIITYGKILSPQTIITAEKRTQLLRKLIPIIDGNKEVLKESFDKNEDPHRVGHMKVGQFMRTLLISHLFTPEEVELIINPICWPFTSGGRIRFSGLFELHKLYESDLKMRESGIGKHRGKKLVDQLFGALKKVGKKHKLNEYELFRCFDIDDSGFLTLLELRKNLTDMKIDLTEDQFADIMKELDKDGSKKITWVEFKNYLKTVEI